METLMVNCDLLRDLKLVQYYNQLSQENKTPEERNNTNLWENEQNTVMTAV